MVLWRFSRLTKLALLVVNRHSHQGIPPRTDAPEAPVAAAADNEEPPAPLDDGDADPDADMYTDTMPDLESFSADSSDGPPDMPLPDPPPAAAPLSTTTMYFTHYEYDIMSTESPVTTLVHIDSSYDYDDEYPDPTDYDAYDNDDLPDYYYDNLSMIQELPSFASVPASELARPFLSSAGTAAEDIEIPHPCILTDAVHFMEVSVEDAQAEYHAMLLSHINPDFLAACPELLDLMSTLGLEVFVPQNWDGARIPALSFRFAPDFPATLHARAIPVNPRLYSHAKQEFDRLRKYHFVPSNPPPSSLLLKKLLPSYASVATTSPLTSISCPHNTLFLTLITKSKVSSSSQSSLTLTWSTPSTSCLSPSRRPKPSLLLRPGACSDPNFYQRG